MKERIVRAAAEELLDSGVKFTMADLAARLAISKRTLYEHFDSKEAIVAALVDSAIRDMKDAERVIFEDGSLTLTEKLRRVLCVLPNDVRFVDARLLAQIKRAYPDEWERIDRFMQEEWGVVTALLEEGIRTGVFVALDVPAAVQAMRGAFAALFDTSYLIRSSANLNDSIAAAVDMFVFGLAGRER
ncbi:TetR/AcrR family transcriptional regulator [Paenibacillus flagellatus]|uniref:TetR/AcrR family transcriptional regulator n=1 Tax=Paenibacillus flagellatus TaxID=2211139 RepID=A0A2V5K6Y9_9BACL|nr:TetR/AcrR family transcriptional regulator [Paenibacillus flagellatus]PYI54592.1 TetR/AcrR family transcriptional regulator [Paenibacillus flagellatus]